jgi:hypothetical protein
VLEFIDIVVGTETTGQGAAGGFEVKVKIIGLDEFGGIV